MWTTHAQTWIQEITTITSLAGCMAIYYTFLRIKQKYHKYAEIVFTLDKNEKRHKSNITQFFFLNLIDSKPRHNVAWLAVMYLYSL